MLSIRLRGHERMRTRVCTLGDRCTCLHAACTLAGRSIRVTTAVVMGIQLAKEEPTHAAHRAHACACVYLLASLGRSKLPPALCESGLGRGEVPRQSSSHGASGSLDRLRQAASGGH